MHYLESLVDLGPKAVPAISAFLRERLDREFLTTRQSLGLQATPFSRAEQLRRGITNPLPRPNLNHVSPPSLRLGCFTVLLQLGGPKAEQALLEVLVDTASGAEIAWLDEILERLNPVAHRAKVLAAAHEILRKPAPLDHASLLNRQSRRYLIAVLIRHRDLDLMRHFQTHLIDAEGHLDPLAFRYLLDVQGAGGLSTLIDLCRNRLKHPDEKRVVRDRLLRFTGTDPAVDTFFKETLQAALKQQNGQANRDVGRILMSLNFSPTPGRRLSDSPSLIRQRLKLIEWAAQQIQHPHNLARLRSAETTLKRNLEPPKENP